MNNNKLYQYSSIVSLMESNFEGDVTFKEVKTKGNFGLGTFNSLDGEMIALDGNFYHMFYNGDITEVKDSERTPFISVCNFITTQKYDNLQNLDNESFIETLESLLKEQLNKVIAVKIKGHFEVIKTRTVAKQAKPYKKIYEINNLQSEIDKENVNGTVIGYYTPAYLNNIGVEGMHFHFINDERNFGGHVLNFNIKESTVEFCVLDGIDLNFSEGTFAVEDIQEHIKKIEGN